jgi:hypothetical protein
LGEFTERGAELNVGVEVMDGVINGSTVDVAVGVELGVLVIVGVRVKVDVRVNVGVGVACRTVK